MVEETNTTSSSDVTDTDTVDYDVDYDDSQEPSGGGEESKKSARARINELSGRLKEKQDELTQVKAELAATKRTPTPPVNDAQDPAATPEAQRAIAYLENLGFVRKDLVEAEVGKVGGYVAKETAHLRLGREYDGSDGRPKYDQEKVEKYASEHHIGDFESAYKLMHESELLDWNLKKANTGESRTRPFVERPGSSGVNRTDPNAITREKLQEVANNPTPANRLWYERNRLKALDMMARGEL